MTSFVRAWKEHWHWFALFLLTFLANAPLLSPSVLFSNDTLHALIFFHFAYADLIVNHEIPRWMPYLNLGTTFDFNLFNTILPTDYVMMLVGWLAGIKDSLMLYKVSLILSESALILGMYLLARKFFTSMLTVWLVCLGVLLTTSWTFCSPWSLTAFYLLPLELWFVLRFIESKNPAHLWLAGLTEGLSLLGTIPYIAPLHLFIVIAFLIPFLCREPSLFWHFLSWRNFVHPLFFLFVGYFALLGIWIIGFDVIWTAPGRDFQTGNIPLTTFLGRDLQNANRQSLAVMLRILVKGDLYYGEFVNYIGILPLATLAYALLRRRDTLFLSIAVIVLALLWFSLGGWFSTLIYYAFPMMKKYRFISAAWNFQRLFLLILAGFGFDQLLRDLRGLPAPSPTTFTTKARWVVLLVLACFVADHLFHGDQKYFSSPDFYFNNRPWPDLFKRQAICFTCQEEMTRLNQEIMATERAGDSKEKEEKLKDLRAERDKLLKENQLALLMRILLSAAVLGVLWFLLTLRRRQALQTSSTAATPTDSAITSLPLHRQQAWQGRPSPSWIKFVGPVLFAFYLVDVGFYFSQVLKQSPWCPPDVNPSDAFQVSETIYRPQRYSMDTLPDDARKVWEIIVATRGGSPEQNPYTSSFVLMQADFAVPTWQWFMIMRLDLMMPSIKNMLDARGNTNEPPFKPMLQDPPFKRSVGYQIDKARIIREHDVIYAANESQAMDKLKTLPDPDQKVIIQAAPSASKSEAAPTQPAGKVEAVHFTANRVVFKLPEDGSGWLFYADAYDPGWKALVDGQPAEVYRANVGFKAVPVPQGAREVTFYFDRGWREKEGLAFIIGSTVLALALTALLFLAPWVLKTTPEPAPSYEESAPASNFNMPLIWSAFAWLAVLTAGLLLFDLCLLMIVPLAALFVYVVHHRVSASEVVN